MKLSKKRANQKGFTLVELAIVLVIIGLIVGGVLAGQDLIKAATIRAATTQLTQYDTGALTFQNKYNALPGDIANATANTNFSTTATTNTTGAGDQNGMVESVSAANTLCAGTCIAGEAAVFWTQLNKAALISDAVTVNDPTNYALAATGTGTSVPNAVPKSKLGAGAYVTVQANSGLNFYELLNPTAVTLANGGDTSASFKAAISPLQASQIDSKLDDGSPSTGKVLQIGNGTATAEAGSGVKATTVATAGASSCATSTTAYNTGTQGNNQLCKLSIRASF